jgi:hypothetical protein
VVRAGTSKTGLRNKPAGCGAAEAYTLGPGSEEEGGNSLTSFIHLCKGRDLFL